MTRELIRRLILLGGILQAIWLFLYIPAPVLDVRAVDFAKKYQEQARPRRSRESLLGDSPPKTLEAYIAGETGDRLIEVNGPEWAEFLRKLPETGKSRYFRLGDKPLVQLKNQFASPSEFRYLRLGEGTDARYISVNSRSATEAVRYGAPSPIAYPFRGFAWIFAAIGIAGYIIIPRLKRLPDAIVFGRASAVYVPDVLGVGLTGLFFALPLLIAPDFSNISTPRLFSEGIAFVLFLWPFCLGGLIVCWYAAHYASFQIVLTDQAIRWVTHGRDEAIRWDDIAAITPAEYRMPLWLRVLAILVMLANPRAAMSATHINRYHRTGIILTRRDGWKLKLWSDMPGFERITTSLAKAGHSLPTLVTKT